MIRQACVATKKPPKTGAGLPERRERQSYDLRQWAFVPSPKRRSVDFEGFRKGLWASKPFDGLQDLQGLETTRFTSELLNRNLRVSIVDVRREAIEVDLAGVGNGNAMLNGRSCGSEYLAQKSLAIANGAGLKGFQILCDDAFDGHGLRLDFAGAGERMSASNPARDPAAATPMGNRELSIVALEQQRLGLLKVAGAGIATALDAFATELNPESDHLVSHRFLLDVQSIRQSARSTRGKSDV